MDSSSKKKQRDRTPEGEPELFRSMVSDVDPIPQDRIAPYRPEIDSSAEQRRRDEREVMGEIMDDPRDAASFGSGDELTWLKNGYPRIILRRLRRGHYAIQEEIDLHGYRLDEAKKVLGNFLHECSVERLGCVRVIHGKGRGSPGRIPVIKGKVLKWLSRNDDVIAVCSAPSADGGTGAVYVLLDH